MEKRCTCVCFLLSALTAVGLACVNGLQLYNEGQEPRSPCSESSRADNLTSCLEAIRKRAEDPSIFWFGNIYASKCGQEEEKEKKEEKEGKEEEKVNTEEKEKTEEKEDTADEKGDTGKNDAKDEKEEEKEERKKEENIYLADCYNPRGRTVTDSMVSRLFPSGHLDPGLLDTYLTITYTTQPGSYKACENEYTYNVSREISINPLSIGAMTPYEVRAQPSIWWPADDNTLFTLLFYDVGYFIVKALYVNIPGNKLTQGETIVEYEGPLNPTRNNNPYVFLLFRQKGPINLADRWIQTLSSRVLGAELGIYITDNDLTGPVALNWVQVYGDVYGAEMSRLRGTMNTCAHFVAEAFSKEDVKFIPNKTYFEQPLKQLNVFVNVTFEASATSVNSCCSLQSFPARTFNLNPLGNVAVLPAHARSDVIAYVTLHMATAFPDTQRDFEHKTLTLVMADPDVPFQAFGNHRLPFLHWLVVNIRGGDIASGDVVRGYMGPAPPDAKPHRYYFLLFLQSNDLVPEAMDYSAVNCSWDFRGRCRFNVRKMVIENKLQLIGVTWMTARFDAFVREIYVQAGLNPRCAACHGVPGYADPCPATVTSSASFKSVPGGIVILFAYVLLKFVL